MTSTETFNRLLDVERERGETDQPVTRETAERQLGGLPREAQVALLAILMYAIMQHRQRLGEHTPSDQNFNQRRQAYRQRESGGDESLADAMRGMDFDAFSPRDYREPVDHSGLPLWRVGQEAPAEKPLPEFVVPTASAKPNQAEQAGARLATDMFSSALRDAGWEGGPVTRSQESKAFKNVMTGLHPDQNAELTPEQLEAQKLITGNRASWRGGLVDDRETQERQGNAGED